MRTGQRLDRDPNLSARHSHTSVVVVEGFD